MHASPFDFESAPTNPNSRVPRAGLQYLEAYQYYFNHPKWILNLLLATVCQIIPVVGPIVLLGYEYELILSKHRYPFQLYPDFDFDRFTNYLTRGIWPFLVQLIQALVVAPVFMIAFFLVSMLAGLGAVAQGPNQEPLVMLLIFPVMFVIIVLLVAVSALVMTPLVLRAGLTCDLGKTFDLEFVKDFIRRVGWETLYAIGFLAVSSWIVMMAGALICCVGIYPAITLILLAHTHLNWQLYELYLARGGMPIPLPEDEVILADRA